MLLLSVPTVVDQQRVTRLLSGGKPRLNGNLVKQGEKDLHGKKGLATVLWQEKLAPAKAQPARFE